MVMDCIKGKSLQQDCTAQVQCANATLEKYKDFADADLSRMGQAIKATKLSISSMRMKNVGGLVTGIALGVCVFTLAIWRLDNKESSREGPDSHLTSTAISAADELQSVRCPSAGAPILQSTAPDVGHHRVLLDWKASVPSKDPIVGYCLYRSKEKGAAKKNPRCADCEQINTVPIPGTRCRDDLVEDDKTYYYVAIAIAKDRQISVASDEALAAIPKDKNSVQSPAAAAYPPCRLLPGTSAPGGPSRPRN
jgi:hypothetical protein